MNELTQGWGAPQPPYNPYPDEALTLELKIAFGRALLRYENPYDAARHIEPTNHVGNYSWIVDNWQKDKIVLAAMAAAMKELGPALARLPTKDEMALVLYQEGQKASLVTDRMAAFKLVCDIMEYIPKAGGNNTNINLNGPAAAKVQRVPVFATEDDWEKKAAMIEHRLNEAG